ncbi:hypothetical protein Hanom_Chr12g01099431 [Helianthus anomalus]
MQKDRIPLKRTELSFKLTKKKTEIPLTYQRKMDGVNKMDENSNISNLLDPDAKNRPWTKVAKMAKPQGQKWHFTLISHEKHTW